MSERLNVDPNPPRGEEAMIQESGTPAAQRTAGYRFGVFELDPEAGELRKDGRLVRIRNQPLKILTLLLARPGTVVTREELHRELWHEDEIVDFDQGLNHSIREIRMLLGDDADSPRFIQTLPRRGYRFLADVRRLRPPPSPDPALVAGSPLETSGARPASKPSFDPGASQPLTHRSAPRPLPRVTLFALLAAGLCVVSLAVWLLRGSPGVALDASPAATVRLLVLPFAAASSSIDDQLVADGLTDEVIARAGLGQSGLVVLGRTSSMEYKNRSPRLIDLQRDVKATYVVEGRVQRTPQGLRAIASLTRIADGKRLWALKGETEQEWWSLQRSVSSAIAVAIEGAVDPPMPQTPARPPSVEANLHYLRGRALLALRDRTSVEAAIRAFDESTRLEPDFAPAWASSSEARIIAMDHGHAASEGAWPMVKASADRALQIDPALAEGWNVLAAYYSLAARRPGDARRALNRALTLNPNLVLAHHWNAVRLVAAGDVRAAESSLREALALDPLSAVLRGNLGDLLSSQGRHDDARAELQAALDLRPDWPLAQVWMGLALGRESRWSDSAALFEKAARNGDGVARAYWVRALVRAGRSDEARSVYRGMLASRGPYVTPYHRALAAFSMGDRDRAISELRETIAQQSPLARQIGNSDDWKGFEQDERFDRLVKLVRASWARM